MSDLFSKVGIDLGVVVLLLIVLIIVMMIMTVSMSLRLSRLNQKYRSFMKGKDAQSLEKLFHQRFKEADEKESCGSEKDPGHDAEQIRNRKI